MSPDSIISFLIKDLETETLDSSSWFFFYVSVEDVTEDDRTIAFIVLTIFKSQVSKYN